MAINFRVCTSDARPERLAITQEVERRKQEAQARREAMAASGNDSQTATVVISGLAIGR
jgi:hypothetical protein